MSTKRRKRELIPPWNMPSDPVKAVWWFMYWLLKVLVRFFWLPIFGMVAYETYLNGSAGGVSNALVAGVVTLLLGLLIWGILYAVVLFLNVSTTVSSTIAEVKRMQQKGFSTHTPFYPFPEREREPEGNVVEGTITDLDEERKKRRHE